ncbi:hypothetical protein N5T16_18560 [Escherichia coli]|uniref:hypothetical protein n=1 Tax=Escherichia coli TaxID=562 RepID=UPI002227F111|nr:hypothetical protein [Escherichia coli]MCW3280825.1 hypothetical protein [Escherichia coli]
MADRTLSNNDGVLSSGATLLSVAVSWRFRTVTAWLRPGSQYLWMPVSSVVTGSCFRWAI